MPKPWEKATAATPQQPTSEPAPTGRKPWEKAARVFSGGQSSANPVAKTAPKPAPMSQPDANPWGDGQAFDDMYARKPQTDPMNMPLMPGARTLTSGQPTQMKPPPVPRGPIMSPAQRQAMAPERAAGVMQRQAAAERREAAGAFGGGMDMLPILDAGGNVRPGTDVDRDISAGITGTVSGIRPLNALSETVEATLNLPGDALQSVMGGNRVIPRADIPSVPLPKELESVTGDLSQGIMQFLLARGVIGKAAPGGGMAAQAGKDAAAIFAGFDSDTPRMAETLAADFMRENGMGWMADRDPNNPLMERVKNGIEEMFLAYAPVEAVRRTPGIVDAITGVRQAPSVPTNAGGARAALPAPRMAPPAVAATQPQQQASGQPPGGPPPQAATAPPVPPVPPASPTATAAAPQPTPAAVAPQPARQALGPAEQAVNAMPRKTREALWRALSNSGMNRQQAEAAIKSLNDLPEGQNSMFDFELVRRFGQQYPRLKTNLQAMGRDWAITIPKDPRKGSPNRVLDDNTSTQIKSEGEFIDRTAQDVFGAPVTNTLEALETTRRTLSSQYNKLLDPARVYGNVNRMRRADRPAYMERINQALERLTVHLQRPEIMAEVPAWVRDRVMLDVAKDMRAQGGKFLEILRNNDPQVAQLIDEGRPLRYTPELWNTLTNIYPTQVAHTLQSAYARAIREALSGPDVVARTAAEELIRLRGGSRVRANALDPDQRGYGLLYYLEEAVPGYRDVRKQYGDIMGAEEAAYLPESFFRIANNDVALDDWIKAKDELSPQQQAALKSGMTTQIQQALRKKHETLDPWELDQPDALSTPNLTTLSQQPVLNALEKAFGADGKKMADAIRAASTRTDRIRSIHPNYGPRSAINQEAIRNASNIYGDPWGSEQNVIDSVSGSLGAAGVLSALNPATAAAAPLLLTGAAAKGLWNQWKRNKQLTGEESEALADFFFRSRRPDLAEQVRGSRGTSAGDYAGAMLRDASIGTVAAAASDGDLLNNDPTTLAIGALGGAGVGAARAVSRNASSKIKPPRNGNRLAPGGAPTPPAGPRPLPGQTSNASPAVTGALVGGAAGYAAAPEDQKGLGLVAGIAGGGVVGNRLAKGAKPKAPPAKPAFDQRFMKEAQRLVSYNGGVDKALKAQQYVIDQLKNSKAPNAQDRLNRAVSVQYAIRRMADRSNRELDEISATAPRSGPPGVKPPPVKMGFGGSRDLPMDEGSRMERAKAQGFDTGRVAYRGLNRSYDEGGGGRRYQMFTSSESDAAEYGSNVVAAYLRKGNNLQVDGGRRNFNSVSVSQLPDDVRAKLHPSIQGVARIDDIADAAQKAGYDSVSVSNVYDNSWGEIPTQPTKPTKPRVRTQKDIDLDNELVRELGFDPADFPSTPRTPDAPDVPTKNTDPVTIDVVFDTKNIRSKDAAFDPSQEQSSKLLAGMSGNSRGIADNLKQDAALAAFGSAGGSFANQDDPQAGALGGMGLALGGKYGPRLANAMRGAGRVKPPPVRGADQAGFGSGKAESRPKPPPKGPSFPPRLAADLNKSKVSPATRATLDQNAALPPGERKSVIEATGWSDDILRIAAPYIRPGSRMESEVGNRIARLVQQANANPVEYALRQTMAKGAYEEAQKRFKQASGARSRAANNLENLRSRNMLNPNQHATQQQLTVHKQRRNDAEQFLSEAARLRDEAKVMLDRADVELMSLPQVRDFANKEIQRITDALGVGGKASPGTAQLPSYNPMVRGPRPIPKPGAVNRPSKQAADELAHLLFEQDMAEKFAKIQSGEITPTQRNTFQQVMSWYARHPSLAAASVAAAGGSAVGYAALATDQGERAVQARENARKRSGQPEPELPGPPAWDWEKLSRNPRFAGDTQAALQALGYKIGKIDNNIRRADGKRTESEKALYHFLWTMDNTRDPEAPPTEAEWDAFKEAALQARRKR